MTISEIFELQNSFNEKVIAIFTSITQDIRYLYIDIVILFLLLVIVFLFFIYRINKLEKEIEALENKFKNSYHIWYDTHKLMRENKKK